MGESKIPMLDMGVFKEPANGTLITDYIRGVAKALEIFAKEWNEFAERLGDAD